MVSAKAQLLSCSSREDLANVLGVSPAKLTYFAFGAGKKYKRFVIPKKNGGDRNITSPIGGLANLQKRLALLLDDVYSPPSYVQGFVKEGSIINNAQLHLNKHLVLNIDLSDFFPSITAGRIIGLLRATPFSFNNEVASTIAGLVCYDGRLPQGAATSPVLSNMICRRMDKELCAFCKSELATYSRYADDITISTTRRNFSSQVVDKFISGQEVLLGNELREIIRNNYFDINPSKTRIFGDSKAKYVTGVKVNLHPNLSRTYVRRLRSMLHAWNKYGLAAAQKEFSYKYSGGGKSFESVVRGRIAHLKNIKGESDLVYRRLYNRFVVLEGKNRPELPTTEIEELYQKIFVIQSGGKHGTGFILDEEWLVSCDHVVETDEVDFYIYSDFALPMHNKSNVNKDWRSPLDKFDLIALPVRKSDLTSKSFKSAPSQVNVSVGESYKVIGFPLYRPGSPPHITPVNVTAIERNSNGILVAFVDKKMVSGNSGSPVLNNRSEIVGIVQRGTEDRSSGDDSHGYTFLPIQEIRRCLSEFKQ